MKSQFRQLFESFPDAMVIVDRDGQIRQANAQAVSLFGYRPGQLDGQFIQALFPGQPLTLPAGGSDAGEQADRHLELVGSRRDSTQFPAEVNIIPLQTGQGTAAVMSITDATEAQRAQFLLERGLEVLESEDRDRQDLLGHLIRAQEEERARIAAGIHDDTIQMITAANLRLQQLRLRLEAPGELQILDKLEQTLRLSLSRLRQLIFDLRPPGLEHGSLTAALRTYLEQLSSDTGITYRLDDRLTAPAPVTAAVLVYRTAQEALANVRKHAKADTVEVQLLNVDNGYLVRIVDDGIGYNPADVEDRPGHLGLTLMRERAQLAGGWCRIESTLGAGTTVEFWIPLDEPPTPLETAGERAA